MRRNRNDASYHQSLSDDFSINMDSLGSAALEPGDRIGGGSGWGSRERSPSRNDWGDGTQEGFSAGVRDQRSPARSSGTTSFTGAGVALLISLLSAGITIVGVVLSIHSFDRSVLEDLQKQTSEMRAELSEIRTRLESTPSCAVTPTKNIRRSGTTTP